MKYHKVLSSFSTSEKRHTALITTPDFAAQAKDNEKLQTRYEKTKIINITMTFNTLLNQDSSPPIQDFLDTVLIINQTTTTFCC